MGIQLMLIAALFVALQNLIFRKSMDGGATTKGYLMIQLTCTFMIAILLNPVRTGSYEWNLPLALFGFGGGIILAGFMAIMGKALESGPPGLTFAVINASSVMPILVMVTTFGASFGFRYTMNNGIGSLLVIMGLLWAAKGAMKEEKSAVWALYAFIAFSLHTLFLSFMEWRNLLSGTTFGRSVLFPLSQAEAISQWYMPMIFLAAALVQAFIFFSTERRLPSTSEISYGLFGGVANGIGTFFMIWAIGAANTVEHAMIIPIFSISCIVLCNLWGQRLYKEKVNWAASALCIAGLVIGTFNWQDLLNRLK